MKITKEQSKLRFVVRTINAGANDCMIQVKYNKNNKKATNQRGLMDDNVLLMGQKKIKKTLVRIIYFLKEVPSVLCSCIIKSLKVNHPK